MFLVFYVKSSYCVFWITLTVLDLFLRFGFMPCLDYMRHVPKLTCRPAAGLPRFSPQVMFVCSGPQ